MNASVEKDLIGICLPDGAQDSLVDEYCVYLLAPMVFQDSVKFLNSEFRRPDVDSLLQEAWNLGVVTCGREIHLTHRLIVKIVEVTTIIEQESEAKITGRFVLQPLMLKSSAQHEIYHKIEVVGQCEMEERAVNANLPECLASQGTPEWTCGYCTNHDRLLDGDTRDPSPDNMIAKVCFDVE